MGIRELGREERERIGRAESMPHRQAADGSKLDVRLESEFGRLFASGKITEPQYEAGLRYGLASLLYLESIEAPHPYGGDTDDLSDDACFRRKWLYAQALDLLRQAGPECRRVVDRVAVYDEALREGELAKLRRGLDALAGEPIHVRDLCDDVGDLQRGVPLDSEPSRDSYSEESFP